MWSNAAWVGRLQSLGVIAVLHAQGQQASQQETLSWSKESDIEVCLPCMSEGWVTEREWKANGEARA